jgi:hypothetical protein
MDIDRKISWLFSKIQEMDAYLYCVDIGTRSPNPTFAITRTKFREKIEQLQLQKQRICKHVWSYDLIDIDPDRSKMICYCECCGITRA